MTDTFRKEYQPLSDEKKTWIALIKENAATLERNLKASSKQSRELSLALTKLEECVMWATKGITA
jgi:hypothetical protein